MNHPVRTYTGPRTSYLVRIKYMCACADAIGFIHIYVLYSSGVFVCDVRFMYIIIIIVFDDSNKL